jgi:hypothetical protein
MAPIRISSGSDEKNPIKGSAHGKIAIEQRTRNISPITFNFHRLTEFPEALQVIQAMTCK